MRTPTILALAVLLGLLSACSSGSGPLGLPVPPAPPGLACAADDDCPPVEPILRPGYREPVYEIRQEPVYEERRTPVWGEKSVDVMQTRRRPVTITVFDPCSGCTKEVELWDTEDQVQVGVDRVRACIGYRTERVQVGSCPKRVQVGWRTVTDEAACPPTR